MKKKRFQLGGSFYEIPEGEISSFLQENPKAIEVKFYDIKGSQFNIPISDVDSFEIDMGLKKKDGGVPSPYGGEAGISAPPSDLGKGFGELKPAEKQPTQIFKEQGVGEDTMLARRLAREQRAAAGGTAGSLTLFGYHFGPRERLRQNLRVAKEDIGELEGLSNAIDRGVLQGKLADMLALGQMPKREDIKEIARINKELTQIPSTGAYQRFNAAPDLKTAAKEFVDNPFEITSQLISESLSALVRHGYSRALAGAGTGAALGSLIPIPGISTAAGAGTGYIAGMGVAGYNLEMASSIMDSFREAGVDVTDEKSLTKAFDDSNTLKKAREFANKRAVPIAIFDMFSAGMGGKLLGKPAKTILGKVGRGAAEVGIQMGMAGAGETAAQLTAGQKINPTAILAEVIGEAGGGAPDIIVGTMIENKKNNQSIRKEAVRLDIEPQQLQDMLDISEASGEITDAQANEIKKEYEDIQKVKQAVPEEFKKNADVIEALEQKRQLGAKKQGLDPVFAKKIDEQIKALDAKIDDIVAVGEVTPEAAPKVPAAPAKAPITTIEVEEAARQMQPITDRMVQIEREFENLGYKIDTDYDNEMIVSDIEGNEVESIPESLVPLAAEYEKATRKLGEFDDRARERALSKSREVVEAEAVEVKPELPAAPAKSRVQDAIDKYDEGDISTINDLVDEIEAIADEEGNQVVLDAVEEYREEQRYNESLKGRGDMDAAEDAFLSKIRGVGEVAPEAAPEVPAAPAKVEPIRQLGTGANVYFENKNYRVNDFRDKVLLNVSKAGDAGIVVNLEFNTPEEAVDVAKTLNRLYPKGVPEAVLLDKIVEDIKAGKYKEVAGEVAPEAAPEVPQPTKAGSVGVGGDVLPKYKNKSIAERFDKGLDATSAMEGGEIYPNDVTQRAAWRSMGQKEFEGLLGGNEIGGSEAKKGNYFGDNPSIASSQKGEGKYLVEFGGKKVEGETTIDKVSAKDITGIWKYENGKWNKLSKEQAQSLKETPQAETKTDEYLSGLRKAKEAEAAPEVPAAPVEELVTIEEKLDIGDTVIGDIYGERVEGKVKNVGIKNGQIVVDIIDENGNERFLYSKNISRIEPSPKKLQNLNAEQNERYLELLNKEEITADEMEELGKLSAIKRGELPKQTELPAAPVTKEEIKTEEYAIPVRGPEGVLQPTQEGVREEGGERRGVESPVERVAAAQESKAEAAKKEIAKREKAYAKPEGKQLAVNELVNELYKFNNQFKGRLGLKTPESDRKRNELLIEAKRLGFQTSVDRYGRISVKGVRAIDKSNSNMAIDSNFVPLEKRSEKLRDFYNKIQGLSQRYGWDFQSFMPNVIIGADGKKMNNRQIANALKDLNNGIPSKGANLVLNDLEAMAEKGFIEVRDGQNVRGVPIDEFFNELTRIAEGDIDRVLGEEVASLPEADLVKWFEEMESEQQFESEIYEEPITPEALPEGGVEPEAKKEVPIPIRAAAGEPTGEAGRGAPPTEGGEKPAPAEEGEPRRLSGIKKGLVSKEVLANVDLDKTGDKQLLMAGRQIIESGEVEPKLLVDKIIDEGRGVLSPAEVVAMITYKADLDTQIEDLTAEIEQLEASGQDIGQRGVKLSNLQDDRQNFDIAAVITAQQQSMAFRLRMWMMDRYYNLQREISEYKKANNGVISEEVRKRFEQYDAEIQKLKKKINELGVEKLDEEGQAAVDNIAEDVEREDAKTLTDEEVDKRIQKGVEAEINKIYEQLPAKKRSRADQAIAALERIQKRLRSRTYDASIGIPVAIIDMGITTIKKAIKAGVAIEKAIELGIDKIKEGLKGKPFTNEDKFRKDLLEGFELEGIKTEKEVAETPSVNNDGTINIPEKFLRDLVRKGINTIDGLVDAAFKELEPQLPELTKRQVRDAITQYGKKVNPTKDEVRQQLGAAKRLGRLISELEDLQKMNAAEFALKYLKKKPSKITEAEKTIKEKIRLLAKELETDAQRLDKAKDAAKRRIDELQRRLSQGDFSKKPKKVLKSDAELETLIAKKLDLEYEFKKEIEKARLRNRSIGEKVFDAIEELTQGVTRSLVAGFDLSATLVQLGRVTFTKPSIAAKAFAEGLRQFVSPKRNENFLKKYRSSYYGVVAKNSGLAISEVNEKISAKEQIFLLNWANAIYDTFATIVTLGHKPSAEFIKLINPLKASQRAFEGAVNYARVNSFNNQIKYLLRKGYRPESDPEIFKSSADFVNTTTGRGSLGKLEGASRWLGNVFFSARKLASEFKLYSPYAFYYYGKMPAPIRKRALANFAIFSANVLVSHVLLRAALEASGEEQDEDFWDPDSPNFLSFKINGKVVSVLGGIKSMIVFMSRLLIGSRYVDQYGIESVFGERVGKRINTKKDLVTQFVYGKFSPGLGALRDYYDQNPNYEDDDEILQNLVVPMWLQDASEIYKDDPASVTAMFNLLSSIGASVRKVDVANVRDKIIFKEKVKGKEIKRVVELTDAQKEEFQNIVNTKFKAGISKISREIKSAKTLSKRAEYIKMAADKAKKDGQEILEKKYKKLFQQFPVQEKEEDNLIQKVKKKLK